MSMGIYLVEWRLPFGVGADLVTTLRRRSSNQEVRTVALVLLQSGDEVAKCRVNIKVCSEHSLGPYIHVNFFKIACLNLISQFSATAIIIGAFNGVGLFRLKALCGNLVKEDEFGTPR